MTGRELLQQALDALKYHTEHTYPFHLTNVAIEALQKALAQPEQESIQAIADVIDYLYGTGADNDMANKAHFALKQLQINLRDQTALHLLYKGDYEDLLAKPQKESVAWRNSAIRLGEDLYSVGPNGYYDMTAKQWLEWALSVVNTAPPSQELAKPEQEPVAWIGDANYVEGQFVEGKVRRVWWECNTGVGQPLYTAPPRKEWVGLTDDEIFKDDEIMVANSGYGANFETLRELTKAIESAVRRKNT